MNDIMIENRNINNKSYIQITNSGWYLAEFYITYIVNRKTVDVDSGVFLIGQTRRLYIDKGTPRVILKVDVWVLGQGPTLYNDYVNTSTSNCYNLTGTIFNPCMNKVQCIDNPVSCNCNQICNPYSYCNFRSCNENGMPARRVFKNN